MVDLRGCGRAVSTQARDGIYKMKHSALRSASGEPALIFTDQRPQKMPIVKPRTKPTQSNRSHKPVSSRSNKIQDYDRGLSHHISITSGQTACRRDQLLRLESILPQDWL